MVWKNCYQISTYLFLQYSFQQSTMPWPRYILARRVERVLFSLSIRPILFWASCEKKHQQRMFKFLKVTTHNDVRSNVNLIIRLLYPGLSAYRTSLFPCALYTLKENKIINIYICVSHFDHLYALLNYCRCSKFCMKEGLVLCQNKDKLQCACIIQIMQNYVVFS